ncbi:MAG: patatin-like phospholipase family protein [Planctomycetota bacterium]|nr:patatin-like phospholipase family protein [Planctomycetota bacterium]
MSGGVVLVLSGGGARALAHLGVLEVLEEAKIPITRIVAVSGGAVVGVLYSHCASARDAQRKFTDALTAPEVSPTWRKMARVQRDRHGLRARLMRIFGYWRLVRKPGIIEARVLMRAMQWLVGSHQFEDLRVPLSIVSTDLVTGREVVFGNGPLLPVLSGSCALPGIFEPIVAGERLLVDSGDINPLPVNVARRYRPDFIIASDVSRGKIELPAHMNGIEVQARAKDAGALVLRDAHQRLADFIIRPRVLRREWSDFENPEEAYRAGRAAAGRRLERLFAGLKWKELMPCKTD